MRLLYWFRSLWANLVHRDRVEESLDDELRAYLDLLTADYERRGFSPDDARRAASVDVGGLAQVKESTRDAWAGDALASGQRELRYTWRSLRRSPAFLVTVVLIIALGIGANATIFGVIDDLLFRPPAHVTQPEGIVLLSMAVPADRVGQQTLNFPAYRTLRSEWRSAEVVAIAGFAPAQVPLGRGLEAENVLAFPVSASYFRMLGVEAERGRFFLDDEDAEPNGAAVAVISDGFWTSHFARDPEVLGKAVEIGNRRFTVVGVAPRGFTGTELGRVDLWLPMTAAIQPFVYDNPNWSREALATYAHLFARVRSEVPFADAAREAGRILANAYPDAWWARNGRGGRLIPLRVARSMNLGTENSLLTLLAAMALIVLLIVIANVASLLLARALRRRREIAVRLALGASRGQLVRLLLTECLILSLISGVVAVFITYWFSSAIRGLLFGDVAWSSSIVNGRLLAFSALAVMVVAVFAGLLPALESTQTELTTALKAGARDGGQRTRSRRTLIVAQVALTTMLLAGAGLFLRSLRNVYALRLGVDTERVLYGQMYLSALGKRPDEVEQITRAQLERVRALPGITHAAVALTIPFGPSWGANVHLSGGDSLPPGDGPYLNLVGSGYFATLGARVLEGREFTDVDDNPASPRVVIVSASMARRVARDGFALGRCIIVGEATARCARIVGVVEDVRRQQLFDEEPPMVYIPLAQAEIVPRAWRSELYLIARPAGDAARMIEPVRRAMQSATAGLPRATVQRIADRPEVVMQIRQWRLGTILFGSFGILALVLAAVGLFGLISYTVASRVHEIGVRMALGARGSAVAGMVVRQALAVDAMGVGAGIVAAVIAQRLIASLLYGVSPYDPIVFATVGGTMLLVGVVASIVPVAQALSIDALEALRAD